jgi:hypothetical protein
LCVCVYSLNYLPFCQLCQGDSCVSCKLIRLMCWYLQLTVWTDYFGWVLNLMSFHNCIPYIQHKMGVLNEYISVVLLAVHCLTMSYH